MSVAQLLKAVPSNQQLPGSGFDLAAQAYFMSGSGEVFSLGGAGAGNGRAWARISWVKFGTTSGNRFVWANHGNNSNYHALRQVSATSWEHILYIGSSVWFDGVTVRGADGILAPLTLPLSIYSSYAPIICWGDSHEWGIGTVLGGEGRSAPVFSKTTNAFKIETGTVNYTTSIIGTGGYLERFNFGTAATGNRWNGAAGIDLMIRGDVGRSLSYYGLDTDEAKMLWLLDPQRIFSLPNVTSSLLYCPCQWTDSADVPKSVLKRTMLAAGDKVACPFSGKKLTLQAGAATATELALPPYTVPTSHEVHNLLQGGQNWTEKQTAIKNPVGGGMLVTSPVMDNLNNPQFYLCFVSDPVGETPGSQYRWPVSIPWAGRFTDSSAGGANNVFLNYYIVSTDIDRHAVAPISIIYEADGVTPKAVVAQGFMHSTETANHPQSGDTSYSDIPYTIMDDGVPSNIFPTSAIVAKTYAQTTPLPGYLISHHRQLTANAAELEVSYLKSSDLSVGSKVWLNSDGTWRNYPFFIVGPMSDGRNIVIADIVTAPGGSCYWEAIITPTMANFATDAEWFTLTGKPCNGSGGNPSLSTMTSLSHHSDIKLLSDNDGLPNDGTGLKAANTGVAWTRSGTMATITKVGHGLRATFDSVEITATSDAAAIPLTPSGGLTRPPSYAVVATPTADTFTITCLNAGGASGTVTYRSGGEHIRLETSGRLSGGIEGIWSLVRISTHNAYVNNYFDSTPADGKVVSYDRTEIRRWTYTSGAAPTLVPRDAFDIHSILEAALPGTNPAATGATRAESMYHRFCEAGPNAVLALLVDPQAVLADDIMVQYWNGSIGGHAVKALLFNKLNSADPTQYVNLGTVYSIPTDNSAGYGVVPYGVADKNDYSKAVMIALLGGDCRILSGENRVGNFIPLYVDLTEEVNAALRSLKGSGGISNSLSLSL